MNASSNATRYYVTYLVWIKEAEKWKRYAEAVAPIARRYGSVERSLRAEKIYFEGRTPPDLVNVVYSESQADFGAFGADPEFQKIVHLRTESTELLWVGGASEGGEGADASPSNASERLYLVELANFGPEGRAAYERYEAASTPVLRRYGYHVERVLRVRDVSPGFPFQPDIVKVAYFDQRDGLERMERDPEHTRIESLYPAAVAQSIWIFGAVH